MSFFLSLLNAMPGAITQGMLWGIMAIGVYITYRILDVADLTVDGSLATGGAVCVMLMRAGWNPWAALLCAFLAGVLAGLCTGLLHTRCGIPAILAGILTQLALYSVNLRIMGTGTGGGKANLPISVDKYSLLVSARYVRKLALNNPILVLVIFCGFIFLGGVQRLAAVTEKLVPLMALFYIAGALIIVVMHAGNIPAALAAIFRGAFNLNAAGGGALGYGISQTITWGFKRGAFSNEAGLGSAVMVNSASNVKEPVHQGMWGVFEVFADTIVVCTLTALVILTTGVVDLESGAVLAGVQDNALVGQAFTAAFGSFGPKFIAVSILLFAYSTTLGWSHYGTKAVEYLFGTAGSRIYKVVFVCMTVVGATMKLGLAWDLSDTFNGLMMIPNLIGVLALSGTVVDITRNYFARRVRGEDIEPMWSAFEEYQKEEEAEAAAEEAELDKAANK